MKTYIFKETNFNATTNRLTKTEYKEFKNFADAYEYFKDYRESDEITYENKTVGDLITTIFDDSTGYAIHYSVYYWDCEDHNEIKYNFTVSLEVLNK